mgnify:CR=1 FL=1
MTNDSVDILSNSNNQNSDDVKYTFLKIDGYESVLKCENKKLNYIGFISVHNTKNGPSLGGCRLWNYNSESEALADCLSLSRAMTLKNLMARVPNGGGKAVIMPTNSSFKKDESFFKSLAEMVNKLNGRYIIAEDVGINFNDIDIVRKYTKFVVDKDAGDPSPWTATGVYLGIKQSLKHIYGSKSLKNKKILVIGVGMVGRYLIKLLAEETKKPVYFWEINENNVNKTLNTVKNSIFIQDEKRIYDYYDIICPCALGGTITYEFAACVNTKLIAGCANNQLENYIAGEILHKRNILYAPDFIINAGGVLQVSGVNLNSNYEADFEEMKMKLEIIPKNLKKIYKISENTNLPTNLVAENLAIRKLYKF